MQTKKKILIAEDQKLISELLRNALETEGFEVLHAANGIELLELSRTESPDVIISDIEMPQMTGIEAARKLRESGNDVFIILVTAYTEAWRVKEALKYANAFLYKNYESLSGLIDVLYTTSNRILGEGVFEKLTDVKEENSSLTTREKEIYELLLKGLNVKEISNMLFLSCFTVENHKKSIFRKLKINSTAKLISSAYSF